MSRHPPAVFRRAALGLAVAGFGERSEGLRPRPASDPVMLLLAPKLPTGSEPRLGPERDLQDIEMRMEMLDMARAGSPCRDASSIGAEAGL